MAIQTTEWTFAFRPNGDTDEANVVTATITESGSVALAAGDWEVCNVVHDASGSPTYYWAGDVVTVSEETVVGDVPGLFRSLPDQSLMQGSGEHAVEARWFFVGAFEDFTYSVSAPAYIDVLTGFVMMPTTNVLASTPITVTATNEAGSTGQTFNLEVTAAVLPDFSVSAQKVIDAAASPLSLTYNPTGVTISHYAGVSVIDPTRDSTTAGGGAVNRNNLPNGFSGPIQEDWLVSEYPDGLTSEGGGLTYANGQSKMFYYDGQSFEYKQGSVGGMSVALIWSEDAGATWYQSDLLDYDAANDVAKGWTHFDFGSAAPRIVEIIGCDQSIQMYGFNFSNGQTTNFLPFDYQGPRGVNAGDSYAFGQGANNFGHNTPFIGVNAQNALAGQSRRLPYHLGCLFGFVNCGIRSNPFTIKPANGVYESGGYSTMHERFLCATFPEFSELGVFGTLDVVHIPYTINDHPPGMDGLREPYVAAALRNARRAQPNALIVFSVGANPPQFGESTLWHDEPIAAFKSVFGETEVEWIANGAYLNNGSRTSGANWTPAGVEGGSPHFGDPNATPAGDEGHPTAAGHDFLAEKYADGIKYLANAIVNGL